MRARIRRLDWMATVFAAVCVALAAATSKNNFSEIKTTSKSTVNIQVSLGKNNTRTTLNAGICSADTTEKDDGSDVVFAIKKTKRTKPKKQRTSSVKTNGARSNAAGVSTSLRRIKKEYKDAVDMGIAYDWVNQRQITRKTRSKNSSSRITSKIICLGPITTNLRQWHFSFRGAGEGSYSQGVYHGQILLPKDYPLSPPSVQMWTPSGRFIPGKDICLSASNYHPETWTPRWSIQGIVNALRLHMLSPPNEIGGMLSTQEESSDFARQSLKWKYTWREGGTIITVDHRLLLQEGVLSIKNDEGEEEADLVDEFMDTVKDDDESATESIESLMEDHEEFDSLGILRATKEEIRRSTETNVHDTDQANEEKIFRLTSRFSFSKSTVASFVRLICLYMIVVLFFNK